MGKDLLGKELGQGFIQKKDGRYEARYVDRFGKRQSVSGRDLKNVRKRYNEAVYENEKEININDNITLDKWFNDWMGIYKYDAIRESTKCQYMRIYTKHIAPTFGKCFLKDITQIQIKSLIKKLDVEGYGFEIQNKVRIMLVDMLGKAVANEYLRKNPAKGITIKRDEKVERRVLSVEEQIDFFNCCNGTFYNNLFIVALTTGMRIGKIAALRWEDIDWSKRLIHVKRTLIYQKFESDTKKEFHLGNPKTDTSVRDIPINNQCEIALKKQYLQKAVVASKAPKSKSVSEEFLDVLFTTKYNTPVNSQIICDAINKLVAEINLTRDYLDEMETFTAHALRHTFATRCFEAGIQPKTVQTYLGHATLQMTMDLYTSVMPKHSTDEMDKVSKIFDRTLSNDENELSVKCMTNITKHDGDFVVA